MARMKPPTMAQQTRVRGKNHEARKTNILDNVYCRQLENLLPQLQFRCYQKFCWARHADGTTAVVTIFGTSTRKV